MLSRSRVFEGRGSIGAGGGRKSRKPRGIEEALPHWGLKENWEVNRNSAVPLRRRRQKRETFSRLRHLSFER